MPYKETPGEAEREPGEEVIDYQGFLVIKKV
jgi:hypothetical protein